MTTSGLTSAVFAAQFCDLRRRRFALGLLIALPLVFYGASGDHAIETTTVTASFSIVGARIFAVLAGRAVDQRLVLTGYRHTHLLAGRFLVVGGLSGLVVLGTSGVMVSFSEPSRPELVVVALAAMAAVGVPLGLLIGNLVPRELEAVLLMIGLVGIQLSVDPDTTFSTLLPLGAPHQLARIAVGDPGSTASALATTAVYGALLAAGGMMAAARRAPRLPPR